MRRDRRRDWASSRCTSSRARFSNAEDLSVAAVTAIVGQTRLRFNSSGHANHAGTTPMHLRRDALAGAAEWITAVESLAQHTDGLVATVGKIDVEPNAANVIAGRGESDVDVRHANDANAVNLSSLEDGRPSPTARPRARNARARWISPPCPWMSG